MYTEQDSAAMHAFWAERDRYGPPSPINVYYLDHDPVLAAQMHCDDHVGKGVVEAAQLLSAAHHVHGHVSTEWSPFVKDIELPRRSDPVAFMLSGQRVYPPELLNHACTEWARESSSNYDWLWRLGCALLDEYELRYKHKHPARPVLWTLESQPPLPLLDQTEPPCMMPEECKVAIDGMYDAVASYRNYYVTAKGYLLQWTRRRPPAWLLPAHDGSAQPEKLGSGEKQVCRPSCEMQA
jgi:hypothetical protein